MRPVAIEAQIACVRRELAKRLAVYPQLIERGSMRVEDARDEYLAMRAVLRTLIERDHATDLLSGARRG